MTYHNNPYLNIAVAAARKAGDHIARMYDQMDRVKIEEKSVRDYVTSVDKESEAIIIAAIQDKYPQHAILAEETGAINENMNNIKWIIDPLDGTLNFIHGFPHFCVSIAVEVNQVTEVGAIYNPISQDLYTVVKGAGAQLNNKRIRLTSDRGIESALIGIGTNLSIEAGEKLKACIALRITGSAALDLAFVASNRLNAVWYRGLKTWDLAAGALLIEEAGGFVSDFMGEKNYKESGNIIAGSKKVHQDLCRILTQ